MRCEEVREALLQADSADLVRYAFELYAEGLKTKREVRCKNAASTGVLNMVWFTIFTFLSKQCLRTK